MIGKPCDGIYRQLRLPLGNSRSRDDRGRQFSVSRSSLLLPKLRFFRSVFLAFEGRVPVCKGIPAIGRGGKLVLSIPILAQLVWELF